MDLANPQAALKKLREFLQLLRNDYQNWLNDGHRDWTLERIREIQHLIQGIATKADPERVSALDEDFVSDAWGWHKAQAETSRLIGILENYELHEQIVGSKGPTLAASRLHPWVWHAAVNLWDGGHYKEAVNAAASAVEEQAQLTLRRGDVSGADLYTQAFKVGKVGETPDGRRLRFKHLDELTEDGKRNQSWVAAHEGAMHFGRGCAQGIRNLNAHGSGELPEQEALEYLASLSVLARWVDVCEAEPIS